MRPPRLDSGRAHGRYLPAMQTPICVEAHYRDVEEVFDSSVHHAAEELFVPCRVREVLSKPAGTPVWLSVSFDDDPGKRFELTGKLLGSQLVPRAGFRFAFDGEPELFRYALARAPRYVDLRARRVEARLPVVCRYQDQRIDAVTTDVSSTGALIQTDSKVEPGTEMSVYLMTSGGERLRLKAQVVRQGESALAVRFPPAPALDKFLAQR
jgi:hypothetical protein